MSSDNLIQKHIRSFAFRELFNELGWDNFGRVNEWGISNVLQYEVDGTTYTLTPVAQKRGFQVYECSAAANGGIPPHSTRQKIDRKLIAVAREHLIIFVDRDRNKTQYWQWTQREKGQPAVPRGQAYYAGQVPVLLAQKLSRLAIALEEEEQIGILEVNTRARQAFEAREVTKTKRFYAQFQSQHKAFVDTFIKGISEQGDREWYASLMLNRLMFVYFIQSKKFLDRDEDYLCHRLEWMQRDHGRDQFYSFYRTFLLRLFHDGLATPKDERTPEIEALIGDIPYLNGGLFELHEIERAYPTIEIPDAAFESLFRFFREWDWHLDTRENRTGKEINPDVLGYIFEKFINQKQMGAYYTKEDITGYISRNTIIPFLFDTAKRDCENAFLPRGEVWRLLAENPDHYIYKAVRHGVDLPLPDDIAAGIGDVSKRGGWNRAAPAEYALPTETWREYVARRQRCEALRTKLKSGAVTEINDLITDNLDIQAFAQDVIIFCEGANLLEAFYDAIAGRPGRPGITVLDPTCGSGAFLFAALNVLFPLYDACLEEMQQFVEEADQLGHPERYPTFRTVLAEMAAHPNRGYFITKKIITNNLYGVDIMEEAVETCKLRLFLQLASLLEPGQRIEPLPDIDFNVRAGNTLVGYTSEQAVRKAAAARLNIYSDVEQIIHQAAVVDTLLTTFRDDQTSGGSQNEVVRMQKAALREELHSLASELDRYLAAEYGIVEKDGPGNYAAQFAAWHKSHQPFHWYSEFYGIMQRGGFDAIIGNPPYLEIKEVNYVTQYYACRETGAIHAMCIERSLQLLSRPGSMSMIVPLALVSTQRMKTAQDLLENGHDVWYANYSWRPGKLFDTVNRALTIFIAVPSSKCRTYSTDYQKWTSDTRYLLMPTLAFTEIPRVRPAFWVPKLGASIEHRILGKCLSIRTTVAHFVGRSHYRVYYRTDGGLYWKVFTDFAPAFRANGKEGHSTRETWFSLAQSDAVKPIIALLSSGTYWWWYTVTSNCRHQNPYDVQHFPIPETTIKDIRLFQLGEDYLLDVQRNSAMLTRN